MTLPQVHVWEKFEITLEARESYDNPYTDVVVWVDLHGPDFKKRVYGFWDGGSVFRVRIAPTTPGLWSWQSGASQADAGLCGERGKLEAIPWTEEDLAANPVRHGFLRPTEHGHALTYADGAPCYLIGDTWWATPTFRYRWTEEPEGKPVGPEMGFKDMVQFRKSQGYNLIAMIAALPAWANDGKPARIWYDEAAGIGVRDAWQQAGTDSAKDMHNEGGRPFLFPGKVPGYEDVVPDFDRINPEYFQYMDRKVDYLNAEGFIPFIEVTRRDVSSAWRAFYDWPESYTRYIQYVFSRYQANNCLLSPIHYDWMYMSIPSRDYNEPANAVLERFGPPPFGTLLSANSSGSTLLNFDQAPWLGLHQIGNWRDHDDHWLLTEIYQETDPPRPALNGEPYYAGWSDYEGWPDYEGWTEDDFIAGTEADDAACRSGMYGSFLSGGLAGHIYGAQGMWGGDIEPESYATMWDALTWRSGAQMAHLRTFVLSEGDRYQDLEPNADLVSPNKTSEVTGNTEWAYCARTPERDLFMLYCETGAKQPNLRGALANRTYQARWFNPRTGAWTDAGTLTADAWCRITLPDLPSEEDWAMKLTLIEA
jgi:hypothetical protein